MTSFGFTLQATDGAARTGAVHTPRGDIRTPAFMPVGTAATVKALYMDQVRNAGADVILGNTYHLMLRPGAEQVHALGGLHKFANWPHPILTDSGGFQVMSLTGLRKMTEEGVTFASHIDGSRHKLTPERSIEIQCLLGSDIQMQLDECTPFPATHEEAQKSMELSLRWAKRSRDAFNTQPFRSEGQALGFEGYSLGGLAVGEGQEMMLRVLDSTTPIMPQNKPRYLMGVGTPDDLVESVRRGVDMFDCVMPTRNGRHGLAFTRFGKVNLRNARHAKDNRPLDEASDCPAARDYSRLG